MPHFPPPPPPPPPSPHLPNPLPHLPTLLLTSSPPSSPPSSSPPLHPPLHPPPHLLSILLLTLIFLSPLTQGTCQAHHGSCKEERRYDVYTSIPILNLQ